MKLPLCACCWRTVVQTLRAAVEVLEGPASEEEVTAAVQAAREALSQIETDDTEASRRANK